MVAQDRRAEAAGDRRLSAAPRATPGRTDWAGVAIIFSCGLAAGAYMTKVAPALPALRGDLGLSLIQSGFLHTMLYALGAAIGIVVGALADRFGQKRFALSGLSLMVAGGLLGAAAQGYAGLLASRFLEGIGFIAFTVAAAPLLVSITLPRDRNTAFSIWACYMPAGGSIALAVSPLALESFGWRSLWLGLALAAAACGLLLARRVAAPAFGGGIGSLRLLSESFRRPGVLALCVAFITYVGQWTSVMTWLPTFVVDDRGGTAARAALVTTAFVLVNIPGNLFGGLLLRRGWPRGGVIALGALGMGLGGMAMFSPLLPDAARFAAVLAFSFLGGVIPASVFSGVPAHARSAEHVGTANGMLMQASHLSQFLVPVAVAWIATRFGSWEASLASMLALSALGIAMGLAVRAIERTARPV